MTAKNSDSLMQAANDYFDALIKSRFIEMFGDPRSDTKRWPVFHLIELSSEDKMPYGVAATAVDYDGEIRYIRITDICEDGKLGQDRVSPDSYEEKHILHDNDFLFARTGSVGRTFLYKEHYGKAVFAGYLIKFVPDTKKIDPVFLYHYTKTDFYNEFIESMSHGGVQANINAKQYGSLKICLPPISMQKEFVNFVDQVDKSKLVFQHMVLKLDELVKSRFIEMFEGGQFECKPLKDLFKTSSGGTPLKSKTEYYSSGTIPWLTSGEVNNIHIQEAKTKITELALEETSAKIPPLNSVLVSMYGSIGYAGILEFEAAINQAICAIHPNPNFTPEWLCYYIRSKKNELEHQGAGVALTNISQDKIRKMIVPCPPIELQNQFTDFVKQVDKSKSAILESVKRACGKLRRIINE